MSLEAWKFALAEATEAHRRALMRGVDPRLADAELLRAKEDIERLYPFTEVLSLAEVDNTLLRSALISVLGKNCGAWHIVDIDESTTGLKLETRYEKGRILMRVVEKKS